MEIESEQVLAPAPNIIASGDVSIELCGSCSQEIVQGIEKILSAIDSGQGGVALGSFVQHPHFQRMAPPRDRQVVRHLPDVMSKAPGKALACAILRNTDRAKRYQAQLLTWNKKQVGVHVKQGPTELVAIGTVKTEAGRVQNSGRKNPRFPERHVLGLCEAVHSKGRILSRIALNGPREGVSHKDGIGIRKVVVHSPCCGVVVDRPLGIAKQLPSPISKVSAIGERKEVEERPDRRINVYCVCRCARNVAGSLGAGEATRRAGPRARQNPSMSIGVRNEGELGFSLSLAHAFVPAEEKGPVVDNRSSDGGPELIALELGQSRIVRFTLLVKKVSRIQIVIAVEFIDVAVDVVAA